MKELSSDPTVRAWQRLADALELLHKWLTLRVRYKIAEDSFEDFELWNKFYEREGFR